MKHKSIYFVFFSAFLLRFLQVFFYKFYLKKRPELSWSSAFLCALCYPLRLFLLGVILLSLLFLGADYVPFLQKILPYCFLLRDPFLLILSTVSVFSFLHNAESIALARVAKQSIKYDVMQVSIFMQMMRVICGSIVLFLFLQIIGVSLGTLLAFGGVGGLILGFAAKDILANFLGTLMLFWDKPFVIGDSIRSPDKAIEGTVERIGWRVTRLRTFEKRLLYVPNASFLSISVENSTRMSHRRIKLIVGVRYQDARKVCDIVKNIESMLKKRPDIDISQTLFAKLSDLGPSSLNILVYCFTKNTGWADFQGVLQAVLCEIIQVVEEAGAQCAFPTATIEFSEGKNDRKSESSRIG